MRTRKSRKNSFLIGSYLVTLFGLLVYSYSQIDLNLTLTSYPLYQQAQQRLITLGYYQRPLSTAIFLLLILSLFILQLVFLRFTLKKKLSTNTVWKLSIASAVLLLFAYPAFSHDIFNYIFDTRILVTHGVSPWEATALDFPFDLWTRFMRWTHRTYPYGPLWLVVTIPFYLLGVGKFSLTLFWFKAIGATSFLVSIWFIRKILEAVDHREVSAGLVLFAFNPLVLIESLVTAHIDAAMSAFFLFAIYLLVAKKKAISSWIALLASAGIKFATAAAIPVWAWWKGEPIRFAGAVAAMLTLVSFATLAVIIFREPLPWYLIPPLSLAALLPERRNLHIIAIALSCGMLLRYAPFLLQGDYSQWVKTTRDLLTIIPLVLALLFVVWRKRKKFLPSFS